MVVQGVELETLHKKSDVWAAGQLTFFVAENNKKYPPHTHTYASCEMR